MHVTAALWTMATAMPIGTIWSVYERRPDPRSLIKGPMDRGRCNAYAAP